MPNDPNYVAEPASPVRQIRADEELIDEIGLCLSGGGYRAMVFHVGVLWRLNEVGYLHKLARISSVSGGSVTSAMLGLAWKDLAFDAAGVSPHFQETLVAPIRRLAGRTIDERSVISGIFSRATIGEKVAEALEKQAFGARTLQDLPDKPRFTINATNVQSAALWRFSNRYMADYRVGRVDKPAVKLAQVVGASLAFPPVLSPVRLKVEPGLMQRMNGVDLHQAPYTENVVLTDGGVYDNLGLETVWKNYRTVLVSDAGGKIAPEPEPRTDPIRHAYRVYEIVDNQVRSIRKRQVIDAYKARNRLGAYWGIRTNIADYRLPTAMPCPFDRTTDLANTPTRLKEIDAERQERLINWGYAVCDAAMRAHVSPAIAAPKGFPYPNRGV
jgi:NTE family protein